VIMLQNKDRDSVVGIGIRYGLDGQGNESQWGRHFLHPSRRPWGTPSLLYNGYRFFHGVKRRDVALTTHPPSSDEVKEIVEL